jgi:hypothetical protein
MARVLRALHLGAYGAVAAVGMALVARPAVLWVRSFGTSDPALPWAAPFAAAFAATALAITVCTAALAVRACERRKRGLANHAALLLAVATAIALRGAAGEARPPQMSGRAATREQSRANWRVPTYPEARVLTSR